MDDLISRKSAIEAIDETCWYHQNKDKDMVGGANSAEHQPWFKSDDVYAALKSVPSALRWIPCKERLPESDMSYPFHEDYLVQYDSGDIGVASWSNINRFWTGLLTEPHWNCAQYAEVTAWMPLPEPPKGE